MTRWSILPPSPRPNFLTIQIKEPRRISPLAGLSAKSRLQASQRKYPRESFLTARALVLYRKPDEHVQAANGQEAYTGIAFDFNYYQSFVTKNGATLSGQH